MSKNTYVLPVIDLFSGSVRRQLVQYALNHEDRDEWRSKGDIADTLNVSGEAVRQNLPPLIQYGVFDVRDPEANIRYYSRADTDVMTVLSSWHEEGGYPLVDLFELSGRQDLVEFFLDIADPDESYSKNAIHNEADIDYEAVMEHIEVLANVGMVEEVDGARGTEYRLNENAEIVQFLRTLNTLLVEAYQERDSIQ